MQVQEEIDQPIKLEYLSGQRESVGSMFEQNNNSSIPRSSSSLPMKPFDDQSMTTSMEITHAAKLLQASQQQIVTPILTTSPASNIASAVKLASMGVQFGPGINPNISNPINGCGTNGTNSIIQNNPPIVNTGNNGPMCVQPGDWVCSKCGFVNWRRRRVCMRCFPLADQNNEMSRSLVTGAALAAQIAAGMEPSADLVASLTTTTTNRRMTNGNQTPIYSSSTSNPTTPNTTLLPSRNNTLNPLTPFKPSQSTSNYVDSTLSFNFQNATISEPQQWNYTQPSPFVGGGGGHQYNNNHSAFYPVQPSPIHSPIIPKMYDQQTNKPELTRHAHSSSVLSSLNRYSAESGINYQDKQSAKSGGATPMEEDQMDLYDLWFGSTKNKQRLDNQTRSNSPQLTKNIFTLSSQQFSPLQNKKVKMDDCETNNGESTNNVVTVSAANETDEIVIPCANEKRYSFTNSGKTFKSSSFQHQFEKGVNGNNNNSRLLPIEPPSSTITTTNANALANFSIVITNATTQKDSSPKQQNCSTTPTRK